MQQAHLFVTVSTVPLLYFGSSKVCLLKPNNSMKEKEQFPARLVTAKVVSYKLSQEQNRPYYTLSEED